MNNMKKIIFCLLLFLTFTRIVSAQTNNSKTEQTEFVASGNCQMCKARIEKAALTLKGVKKVEWDIPTNVLNVIYNSKKQDLFAIHEAIANAGHDTALVKAPDAVYAELPLCCLYER